MVSITHVRVWLRDFFNILSNNTTLRTSSSPSSFTTARILLSPACSIIHLTPETIAKCDLRQMVVMAWCVHRDLIPCEKVLVIPELHDVHIRGPAMFIDLEEVNYPQLANSTLPSVC
jgi:hypothetical protein